MANGDIRLPNESGQIDPRIATAEYETTRKQARATTAPPPAKPSVLAKVRDNWRSFTAKGRR